MFNYTFLIESLINRMHLGTQFYEDCTFFNCNFLRYNCTLESFEALDNYVINLALRFIASLSSFLLGGRALFVKKVLLHQGYSVLSLQREENDINYDATLLEKVCSLRDFPRFN